MYDFKVLLDELVAGGMESPIALNMEDWSKGWIIEDCEISDSKCAGIKMHATIDVIMRRCRSPLYTLPYSSSHRGYGLYDDSSWSRQIL